jgi:hypothetical protein
MLVVRFEQPRGAITSREPAVPALSIIGLFRAVSLLWIRLAGGKPRILLSGLGRPQLALWLAN